MSAYGKTIAQRIQYQRAGMIARLHALDPERTTWTLYDTYVDLMATFLWWMDRQGRA
jgi:hypothetical protein